MLSQAYKDGFADGWSDQSQGRDTDRVIQGHEEHHDDFYLTEYAKGYREGARAYKQRLEGRFGAPRGAGERQRAGRGVMSRLVKDQEVVDPGVASC